MSLVDNPNSIFVPVPRDTGGTISTFRSVVLDASGEEAAIVFEVPKTGTIDKIGLRVGAITQMTNSLKVGLYTVDTSNGDPTSTAYGSMSDAVAAPSANAFTWYALATGASATIQDKIAMKVQFDNFVAGDNLTLNLGVTRQPVNTLFPYVKAFLSGSWANQIYPPNMAVQYSDGSIVEVYRITPWSNVVEEIWSSVSTPNRRGIRFKVPFNCSMTGVWAILRRDGDCDFELYDTDGTTLLDTASMDKDVDQQTTGMIELRLSSAINLTKNSYYRLVTVPTTTAVVRVSYFDVTDDGANKAMDAEPMGDLFHATTINGSPSIEGDWTNTITRRYHMGIIIDQLDDGAGGGSDLIISNNQRFR